MASPLGSTPGIIVGVGVGAAASIALQPAVEVPRQEAWAANPNRILDVNLLARLVAQGGLTLGDAAGEALRDGYGADKLDALVYLSQTVPGIGEATNLWRKGLLSSELYNHALVKAGLDQRYVAPIVANKTAEILGIGDLAYAVVRGLVPAPSWVPVAPPASGDKVPRFPVVDMDVIAEAAKLGYDETMFQILVGRSGLSMAPVMAAQALFRDIIGPNDYLLAIAEGDLRTEWADAVRDVSRQILTAHDAAELQLRGYLTAAERRGYTQAHGMADPQSDLLYDLLGRGLNVHAAFQGVRRGGVLNGPTDQIPPWAMYMLERGNLRPEVYNLAWAAHETYPSYFVTRALLQSGAITVERGQELFLGIGWPEDVAVAAAAAFGTATTAVADKHVTKAQTSLFTTMHKSYLAAEVTAADLNPAFAALQVSAPAQQQVLHLWDVERELTRKQLTPAQVKKAYADAVTNPATGAAWTLDDATAALVARGYSLNDAHTFLAE